MQLAVEKKEENFQRHNASAERGNRNATGHETHNGTLENVEVYCMLLGALLACTRLIYIIEVAHCILFCFVL